MSFLNLTATLGLNATGYQVGMKKAQSQAKAFAGELKSQFATAFSVGAVTMFGKNLVDTADRILDLSDRLGVSTDALQEWEYAAKRTGASADSVRMFFESIAKNRADALLGNQNMIDSFARLGVTMDDLKTKRIDEVAMAIQRMVNGADPQAVIRDMRAIGEESAGQLIPAMQAFDELQEKARQTGQILSEETLLALDDLKESAIDLSETFTGPVATGLKWMSDRLKEMVTLVKLIVNGFAHIGVGLAEGLSFKEALKMGTDAAAETIDEAMARDRDRAKARAERREMANAVPTEIKKDPTGAKAAAAKKQSASAAPNLTEWQKLGASVRGVGNDPLLMESKRMVMESKKMVQKLDAIEKNTKPTPIASPSRQSILGVQF